MKNKFTFNQKMRSGFTLIEVIVVLVIVGVLAAIALPNIFQNIDRTRAAAAMINLKTTADYMDGCYAKYSNYMYCASHNPSFPSGAFSFGSPNTFADPYFNYFIVTYQPSEYAIVAVWNHANYPRSQTSITFNCLSFGIGWPSYGNIALCGNGSIRRTGSIGIFSGMY